MYPKNLVSSHIPVYTLREARCKEEFRTCLTLLNPVVLSGDHSFKGLCKLSLWHWSWFGATIWVVLNPQFIRKAGWFTCENTVSPSHGCFFFAAQQFLILYWCWSEKLGERFALISLLIMLWGGLKIITTILKVKCLRIIIIIVVSEYNRWGYCVFSVSDSYRL